MRQSKLDAIADFTDWLVDKGFVAAERAEDEWRPISEVRGIQLAEQYLFDLQNDRDASKIEVVESKEK
jgi:hypothetical protein